MPCLKSLKYWLILSNNGFKLACLNFRHVFTNHCYSRCCTATILMLILWAKWLSFHSFTATGSYVEIKVLHQDSFMLLLSQIFCQVLYEDILCNGAGINLVHFRIFPKIKHNFRGWIQIKHYFRGLFVSSSLSATVLTVFWLLERSTQRQTWTTSTAASTACFSPDLNSQLHCLGANYPISTFPFHLNNMHAPAPPCRMHKPGTVAPNGHM